MKNVPGTLLVIRKCQKFNNTLQPSSIRFSIDSKKHSNKTFAYVDLPYSEYVIMLSLNKVSNSSLYRLNILWKNQYLYVIMSNNQINKNFTFTKTWEKNGHNERKKLFEKNGLMNSIYTQCLNYHKI